MISAVVLAAGESLRMKTPKQILPWGDKTVLETVVTRLLKCQYIDDEIIVVLGGNFEKIGPIFSKYEDHRLKIVKNNDYKKGMLTSVWSGLNSLSKDSEFILFTLGDMPLIKIQTFNELTRFAINNKTIILAPTYQGRRGHPLIVHKSQIPDIYQLSGPGGLRTLLSNHPERVSLHEVNDEGIIIDIDTIEDYNIYLKTQKGDDSE
ncbi:nucleotidyltransferase family protein [Petrotoga olearia]|nr:nucleotidyltransferase family protein [Petrotoga olearia]RMA72695.1 molybdenum cofactor cytidylyltransferase [Petrotoga olearia]